MLFKYVLSDNEIGVKIFGPIHGGIFVAYVITVVAVRTPLRWTIPVTLAALAAQHSAPVHLVLRALGQAYRPVVLSPRSPD